MNFIRIYLSSSVYRGSVVVSHISVKSNFLIGEYLVLFWQSLYLLFLRCGFVLNFEGFLALGSDSVLVPFLVSWFV